VLTSLTASSALVAAQLVLSLVSPLLPRLSPTNRDLPATQNTRTHTSWTSDCHIQHSQQHGVVGPPVHRRCPAGVRSGQALSPARSLIRSRTTPGLAHLISTENRQPSTRPGLQRTAQDMWKPAPPPGSDADADAPVPIAPPSFPL
jgi:hypothetical protein